MLSLVWSHFSLRAVEAEASADGRIHRNALRVFVERETTNTWMAQLVFLAVAIAGLFFQSVFVLCLGLLHMLVDQAVRNRVRRLAAGLERDEVDRSALGQIERVFYLVGFTWAMATWPLATSLDGLRLILTVVAASGVLVMANTTCFAPRVFRAALTGFAVGSLATLFVIETMPWYVLGAGVAILLGVATGVGVATSRQLVQMLRMQVERDEAIEGQQRTIAALDRARRIATSMAETDSLTGLANRFRFLTRLDDCIENGRPFSLTLLDVDLFKNVNDALGHSVGLATFEAENCFAARLGGDEFALIDARGTFVPMGAALFEAVRERIDSLPREAPDLPPISITGGSATCIRSPATGRRHRPARGEEDTARGPFRLQHAPVQHVLARSADRRGDRPRRRRARARHQPAAEDQSAHWKARRRFRASRTPDWRPTASTKSSRSPKSAASAPCWTNSCSIAIARRWSPCASIMRSRFRRRSTCPAPSSRRRSVCWRV